MLQVFPDITPIRLASRLNGQKLHLYVVSSTGIIRLGHEQSSLLNLTFGQSAGLALTNADGPMELFWNGEVWAVASIAGMIADIEFETSNLTYLRHGYGASVGQTGPEGGPALGKLRR